MHSNEQTHSISNASVLTYGTFDLFHIGHLRLLKRLSGLGNRLIVGISTDSFNEIKGKKTIIPFAQRFEIVTALSCVDLVIEENGWEQKRDDIKKYDVDIFAMGNDWEGKFDNLNDICEVVYLPRTDGVSSTELKKALEDIYGLHAEKLSVQFEILNQIVEDLK